MYQFVNQSTLIQSNKDKHNIGLCRYVVARRPDEAKSYCIINIDDMPVSKWQSLDSSSVSSTARDYMIIYKYTCMTSE